jgi:ATP-dependent exoDNAse (exonuclease V) beta subunit
VTTWNHTHFREFDAEKIVQNIVKGKKIKDPQYKYYGMTAIQIKELWSQNGKEASEAGTRMHQDIENFYNGQVVENKSLEYQYFQDFVADYPDLIPFRTEWMVWNEDLKISGSIDMVFENQQGELIIYDWKRVKEITPEAAYEDTYSKTRCISHLPDTNFWHYALQLNMYKYILEEKYAKKVVGLFLVRLHPENVYKTYERVEIPCLVKEIKDLVAVRKEQIQTKA